MRIYIPIDARQLRRITTGLWSPGSGMAVTDMLRDMSSDGDEEVLTEQVRDLAALHAVLDHDSPLRAVAVVEYPRSDVGTVPGHVVEVTLRTAIHPDMVVCAFLDDDASRDDAAAARAGDADAIARLESSDLMWFDASEIASIDLT